MRGGAAFGLPLYDVVDDERAPDVPGSDEAADERSAPEVLLGASPVRIAILRLVLAHGEVTALDLVHALNITRTGVGKNLDALTRAGFLIERRATHPRGSGGVIYWRADRERIQTALWELQATLFGYSQSNSRG